jgi:hypothetical protein
MVFFPIRIGCVYQRIHLLPKIYSYFATIILLVTNACISVALCLCNAQKLNTYLSVGKVVSNANMDI